jgi:hypothetical protein
MVASFLHKPPYTGRLFYWSQAMDPTPPTHPAIQITKAGGTLVTVLTQLPENPTHHG